MMYIDHNLFDITIIKVSKVAQNNLESILTQESKGIDTSTDIFCFALLLPQILDNFQNRGQF